MSDVDDTEDLVPRSHIRALEEKAQRTSDLEAQLVQAQREAAFAKALGSAAADPKFGYFVKGYEGELTPEAIRGEAMNIGLLNAPSEQTQTSGTNPPPDLAAHARMAATADGAGTNKPIDLIEAFGKRGSKTPEEIMAMVEASGRITSRNYE